MKTEIPRTEIDWLCRAVEQKAQMHLNSSADFVRLSHCIVGVLGDSLSSTTLKRIWGYLGDGTCPQWSSLSVLARYVGFSSWAQFHHFYQREITPPTRQICKLEIAKCAILLSQRTAHFSFSVVGRSYQKVLYLCEEAG